MHPFQAPSVLTTKYSDTVDWEIFTLKIIHMKNFCVVKFSRFQSICEILTVSDYNMDKRLESS